MYLTNKTIITFKPQEQEAMKRFCETNDLTDWQQDTTTVGISYIREVRYVIDTRGEEDE